MCQYFIRFFDTDEADTNSVFQLRIRRAMVRVMFLEDLPGTGGFLREEIEDFVVEEIPAYLPQGEGEHLMVMVEKRNKTTDEVAELLGRWMGVSSRDIGFAGRKDKRAVTTQWFSLLHADATRLNDLCEDGLRVLKWGRHGNKIRTGHLHGNRFNVVIRGVVQDAETRAQAIIEKITSQGLPNRFGPQRFGATGRNWQVALAWIQGQRPRPRQARRRKLWVSALQAELFNRALARRIATGFFTTPLAGDVMKLHDTGGMFVAKDTEEVASRMNAGENSPTGPIFGARMWWPEDAALELEMSILEEAGLTKEDLARFRADGKGTRRPLRVFPWDVELVQVNDTLSLSFALVAGAFATTFLQEITKSM